jgi:hypothetical protein
MLQLRPMPGHSLRVIRGARHFECAPPVRIDHARNHSGAINVPDISDGDPRRPVRRRPVVAVTGPSGDGFADLLRAQPGNVRVAELNGNGGRLRGARCA